MEMRRLIIATAAALATVVPGAMAAPGDPGHSHAYFPRASRATRKSPLGPCWSRCERATER